MPFSQKELNKCSDYASNYFNGLADKVKTEIQEYRNLEENWDSYGSEAMPKEAVDNAEKAIEHLKTYFKTNCGLLNNRQVSIEPCPLGDSAVMLTLEYHDEFELDLECYADHFYFLFRPQYRLILDGTKTIADRDFDLTFSEDKVERKSIQLNELFDALHESFMVHKWEFKGKRITDLKLT